MKTSIGLVNRVNIQMDDFYLDAYSFQKYKTPYFDNKTKINAEIKALSEDNQTTKVRDIKMLMLSEMLSEKNKRDFLFLHQRKITKFT